MIVSSLFGSISISLRALLAQQAALQTTSDNISNINTPGYSRRRVVMVEEDPVWTSGIMQGNGVEVHNIESLRDRILDLRMHEQNQELGSLQGFLGPLQQVETAFSSTDSGIGASIDAFFNSFTRLSTDPASMPLRQNVLMAAGNLASAVSTSARKMRALQQDLDRGVSQDVSEVNQLTSQIASLNVEVCRLEKLGSDAGAFEDQRTELIGKLSALIGVSTVESSDGTTISTANGAALVVGGEQFSLQDEPDAGGSRHVYINEADITASISGGHIGGLVRARDVAISNVLEQLNTFASSFAAGVNDAHAQGFDLNGNDGGDIFSGFNSSDPAANLKVVMTDPAAIAASGNGTVGDNANIAKLDALRSAATVQGKTPGAFYSALVADIGNQVATAKSEQDAGELILQQLTVQQSSVSGVSLDEEAANLIRYQRAFEAAARVISVVNDLAQTVINLGRN
jgi:flagellar hook-associated protein 1